LQKNAKIPRYPRFSDLSTLFSRNIERIINFCTAITTFANVTKNGPQAIMEKDALLEIVLHDLKEVETLVQSFKGKPAISQAFFKLTRNKVHSILEEIEMLAELTGATQESSDQKAGKIISEPSAENNLESNTIAKPGKKTFSSNEPDTEPDIIPEPIQKKSKPEPSQEPANAAKPVQEKTETNHNSSEPEPTPEKQQKQDVPTTCRSEFTEKAKDVHAESMPDKTKNETSNNNKVLGEQLRKDQSFNDHIARNPGNGPAKRLLTSPPIADLKRALGINDRFFFQRELFGGNANLMNQTLDQLNEMDGVADARNFLLANFNWDKENDAVASFLELIERRFI
jgi:outer membrane biosynthesis protein TonB